MWQNTAEFMIDDLPKLEDTEIDDREELFVQKLHLCSLIYDWTKVKKGEEDPHKKEKEIQMETILEIKEYVEDPPLDDEGMCFRDVIFANLVNCFEEVSTDGGYNEQT